MLTSLLAFATFALSFNTVNTPFFFFLASPSERKVCIMWIHMWITLYSWTLNSIHLPRTVSYLTTTVAALKGPSSKSALCFHMPLKSCSPQFAPTLPFIAIFLTYPGSRQGLHFIFSSVSSVLKANKQLFCFLQWLFKSPGWLPNTVICIL